MQLVFLVAVLLACFRGIDGSRAENDVRAYYGKIAKTTEILSTVCDECKMVVGDIKALANDTSKLNRVKVVLKIMCDYIGGQQAAECKGIVDNLDFLIHQLEPYFDNPEEFCREIHLCGRARISTYSFVTMKALKATLRASKATNSNGVLCDECIFASTELGSLLRKTDIQQQLKNEFESTCRIFYSMEHKCDEYVEMYFPYFLQFLQSLLSNPQQFCAQLQICASDNAELAQIFITSYNIPSVRQALKSKLMNFHTSITMSGALSPIVTGNRQGATCLVCRYWLRSIITRMENKSDLIASRLSNAVCKVLPDQLEADCFDFASIYAATMVRMTLMKMNPEQMCIEMGVCTNKTIHNFDLMTKYERDTAVCDTCHAFADFVCLELGKPDIQKHIVAMVKKNICPALPGDLANQCMDTVDEYVPRMMNRMANYLKSPSFCKEMGMCY